MLDEVERRIHDVSRQLENETYEFDRRFLFRVLSMGHSQLAEHIGARGPNTQVNSACASTTQAVAIAEDWIRAGRCRRVVIVAADDATSDTMMGWLGAGLPGLRGRGHRRGGRGRGAAVRPAAPRHDHRHGRRGARRRERRRRARARDHADLRGARLGHRQLGVPRHAARRRAHRRRDGGRRRAGRAPRRVARGDRAGDRVRLARDLHARPRRQRRRRDPRAAPGLRRRRGLDRDRQQQGHDRPPDGRRDRGRARRQGARDGRRAAGPELPRRRPGARAAQPLARRGVPDPLRAAPRRRLRLADQHDPAALDPAGRRPPPPRRRARLRLPDRRPADLDRVAASA